MFDTVDKKCATDCTILEKILAYCTRKQPRLEHGIVVGRLLRDALEDIPMFDDFPIVIEPENINACPISIPWPLLVTVQDNIVPFSNHPLEMDSLSRVLLRHAREILNKRFLAISHAWIVLDIDLSRVSLDSFGWLILVEHQVIKLRHRLLVALQLFIHDETPSMLVPLKRRQIHSTLSLTISITGMVFFSSLLTG
jgi:hypothetical protein